MCGIFAFAGPGDPDPDLLAEAAHGAGQRGPHGHGWDGPGVTPLRRLGPLDAAAVRALAGPRILGHARLATFGVHDDPSGLQPVAAAGHLLAHNGNAYNAPVLAPDAATDSAALVEVYATLRTAGFSAAAALAAVVARAEQTAWAIVVLDATGELVAHRHGLPLWRYHHHSGTYLSSRPFQTGPADEMPEDQVVQEGGRLAHGLGAA